MSLSYSGVEPQPSLAWTFESSNVDIVTGLTPSAQVSPGPAQLQGSAALVTNAPTSNTAVSFDGSSGYMNLGTTGPTNFNHATSNLFVETWVYVTNATGVNNPFYMHLSPLINGNDDYTLRAGGKLQVWFKFSTTSINLSTANSTPINTWTHLAVSFIPSTSTAYVFYNGFMDGTAAGVGTIQYDSTKPTIIGNSYNQYFNGYIRDLRVVQGGVVPVATFTPGAAPFSYASPGYVANMGTTVFTLLGQFITYNPSGKYGSSLVVLAKDVGGDSTPAVKYWTYPLNFATSLMSGFTVSLWIKFFQLPASGMRSLIWGGADAYFNQNAGSIVSGMYDGSGFPGAVYAFTPVIGTWYHYTSVYGNGTIITYLNGSQVGTGGFTTARNLTSSTLNIASDGGVRQTSAEYDDFRIYNTALTSTQVQSVYSSQGAPAPSRAMPLPKLAWDFNGTTTEYMINRSVSLRSGWAPTYGTGKYNKSLIFTNQAGVTPPVTDFSCTFPWTVNISQGFTIAFWVKINVVNNTYIIHMGNTGTGWGININDGGGHYINENGTYPYNSQNYNFVIGQWCHVLLSIGSAVSWYKNGSILGSPIPYVAGTASVLQNRFWIGSDEYYGFNGEIDDLRIFDRALTSAQVQSIYNQQGVPGRGAVVSRQLVDSSISFYAPFDGSLVASGITPTVTGSAPFNTNGKYGQSVILRNDTDGVTSNTLDYGGSITLSSAQGVTYAVWVKFLRVPTSGTRVNIIDDYPFYGYYLINLFGIYGFYFNFYYANPSSVSGAQNGFTPVVGTWYHVAYTIGGGYVKLYFNGQLITTSAPFSPDLTWTGPGGLGKGSTGESPSAEFDDYRLYKRELSASEIASVYNTPFPSFIKSATGGNTVQDIGGYRIHTFTTVGTSTFTPVGAGNVEVLVVAGGGSGGMRHAGGGGAGGLIYNSSFPVSGAVTVTVGDGGAGLPQGTNAAVPGNAGSNSVFGSLTSIGGGYGNQGAGGSGGSGGGTFNSTVGTGTAGQGNNGAFGSTGPFTGEYAYGGGGGGGAGAPGTASTSVAPVNAGAGGIGLQYSISSTPVYYAGGGGGGTTTAVGGGAGGAGGLGGGGAGGGSNSIVGIAGTNGTGGGGGCGGFANAGGNFASGKGGSGIVIVRYPLPVRLTGTPLFSQLSSGATSSAVGAFSLRAVNGTSAKAVAVQAHPVVQWPPVALTTNPNTLSSQTYGNGTYTISATATSNGTLYNPFSYATNGFTYWSSPATYIASGAYTGSNVTATSYFGEWLQIQLPTSITLKTYSVRGRPDATEQTPRTWYIFGSSDGSTWTLLDTQTSVSWPSSGTTLQTFTPSSTTVSYLYFRFVVNAIGTSGYSPPASISQWILNGSSPSYAPNAAQDFYADRLGNLLTAPVVGQSLANWLGGATGYVTTWYDQSGKGNDASQGTAANQPVIQRATKGAGYSCVFNGAQGLTGMSHTVLKNTNYSVVINERRTRGGVDNYYISSGNDFTNQRLILGYRNNTTLSHAQYANDYDMTVPAYAGVSEPMRYTSYTFSSTNGKFTYNNGSLLGSLTNANGKTGLSSISGNFTIGSGYMYYTGEIYEILVFTQSLYDLDNTGGLITQVYQNQLGAYGT